jgi:hypothetical protein
MKSQTLPTAALPRSHSLHGRAALARLPHAFRPGTPGISGGLAW